MNNKIALVPLLYDEINYGGVLQFYALQEVLRNSGYVTDILFIDDNDKFMQKYKTEPLLKKIARSLLRPYLNYRYKKNIGRIETIIGSRIAKTDLFKEKYYSQTQNYCLTTISDYKAVICGSDQIWNPNNVRRRLFLADVPQSTNRIIYAASLGCESLNEKQQLAFRKYTQHLKHISVREISAKKILSDCLERDDITVVADPTLLLKASEWEKIIPELPPQYIDSDYILVYMLGNISNIAKGIISEYAEKHNKKIIRIAFASGESYDTENFGDIQLNDQDPQEFLMLIRHAGCIFTDSFHACVFSTLFKKAYYVFIRDGKTEMLGRITTLLNRFNLPMDLIINESNFKEVAINYDNIEKLQNTIIKQSMDYLLSSIDG